MISNTVKTIKNKIRSFFNNKIKKDAKEADAFDDEIDDFVPIVKTWKFSASNDSNGISAKYDNLYDFVKDLSDNISSLENCIVHRNIGDRNNYVTATNLLKGYKINISLEDKNLVIYKSYSSALEVLLNNSNYLVDILNSFNQITSRLEEITHVCIKSIPTAEINKNTLGEDNNYDAYNSIIIGCSSLMHEMQGAMKNINKIINEYNLEAEKISAKIQKRKKDNKRE